MDPSSVFEIQLGCECSECNGASELNFFGRFDRCFNVRLNRVNIFGCHRRAVGGVNVSEIWVGEHGRRHASRPFHYLWAYIAEEGRRRPSAQDHDLEDRRLREEQGHCRARAK